MNESNEELMTLWTAPTVFRPDLFSGQTLLVTGGGGGIGCAVALLAARLGARVVICGRTAAKLERVAAFAEQQGADVCPIAVNVREHEQVEQLFSQIETQCGRLDGVINSAGGQFAQPAIDYSPNGWNAVITNNLNASWFVMQRAAKHWRVHSGPGSIVNVVVVTERGIPGIAHSVAARAGVIGAMRTVAVEWAPLGIRVNCVAPGLTATKGLDVYPPEARKEFPFANPTKRPGTPMEIAEGCIYLTAPSGSFVTGEVLTIDGGGRLWGEMWTAGRPDYYRRDS
jgi:citronellol/citronellal dehydrogenase